MTGWVCRRKRPLGRRTKLVQIRGTGVLVVLVVVHLMASTDCLGQAGTAGNWRQRRIRSEEIRSGPRPVTESPVVASPVALDGYLDRLEQETATRVINGEFEHLVHYALQSRWFTRRLPLEPALSAREYVEAMPAGMRERFIAGDPTLTLNPEWLPRRVAERMGDLLRRLQQPRREIDQGKPDERWRYFSRLIASDKRSPDELLRSEYARTMRFLYRKEFLSREVATEAQAGFIAALYWTRAHSTDTQLEAGFGIDVALAALGAGGSERPRIERVLLVGPGHDLAPRTGFLEELPPQSLQPLTLVDSLVRHGLADLSRLQVHAVDINPRVVDHLRRLGESPAPGRLDLVTGLAERNGLRFSDDFRDYFRRLGSGIGVVGNRELPPSLAGHLGKQVEVDSRLRGVLTVGRLNIIAERYDPSPRFDLIVVTNVFPYFETGLELPLAVANMAAMMAPGGRLIHNELGIMGESVFSAVGLPIEQVRTLLIASAPDRPLYDGVVIHRKQ